MYERVINQSDSEILKNAGKYDDFGQQFTDWDQNTDSLKMKEVKSAKIEKKLDQDMSDLVEYTKWIAGEIDKYRERVKKAEGVMKDLKSSGESSVESLMETMYLLKIQQEDLDKQTQGLQDQINVSEALI